MNEDERCYTFADVGLRGDRPFRVCTTHWDSVGQNVPAGDDPLAPAHGSRVLELYAQDLKGREPVPLHGHEFHEFVFVRQVRDNAHVTPSGRRMLRRGDVIILAPGARHGFDPMIGLQKTDLFLQPQWLSDELRLLWREGGLVQSLLATSLFELHVPAGLWHIHLPEEGIAACEAELDCIIGEARRSHPSLALFSGCFLKLLSIIDRCHDQSRDAALPVFDPRVWSIAARIEEAIERGDEPDPEQLAKETAVSRRTLDRLFRATTGASLGEYYRMRRIQHGARMLMDQHASIKEVAHRLNFADTAHFVRLFRDRMGETPGQYRRRQAAARANPPMPGLDLTDPTRRAASGD